MILNKKKADRCGAVRENERRELFPFPILGADASNIVLVAALVAAIVVDNFNKNSQDYGANDDADHDKCQLIFYYPVRIIFPDIPIR